MISAADSLLFAAKMLSQEEQAHAVKAPPPQPASADKSLSHDLSHTSSQLQYHPPFARASSSLTGSRKRKAYKPRSSGEDFTSANDDERLPTPMRSKGASKGAAKRAMSPGSDVDQEAALPAAARRRVAKRSAAEATDSLAVSRPRRAVKRGSQYDADAYDLSTDAEEPEATTAAPAAVAAPTQCASKARNAPRAVARPDVAAAVVATAPVGDTLAAAQRMFQAFRKRACTAYTGVVVHAQNMKLEARVNMVSYLPARERKIGGGQVYVAYMSNPHQAAVVHDVTASIMTAAGIAIYHSHHRQPCANEGVALERLNYLDTLEVNTARHGARGALAAAGHSPRVSHSSHTSGDHAGDCSPRTSSGSSSDAHMLSPPELKRELHEWVAHDGHWLTFKAWLEDVLFESKLASMCLMPKVVDEGYVSPAEWALLCKHVPEVDCASNDDPAAATVFTHPYDSLEMERVVGPSGETRGFTLLRKLYRRRRPELRSHSIKWAAEAEVEEAPTAEDQRRVDAAWATVQRWLRHWDADAVPPPPRHAASDANYYATWSQFAHWVNALQATAPGELAELRVEAAACGRGAAAASGARGGARRQAQRIGAQSTEAAQQRLDTLQAVYDSFREVVAAGTAVAESWHEALPQHRAAFEHFSASWRPLPASMAAPGHASSGSCAAHGRGSKRASASEGYGAATPSAPQPTRRSARSGAATRRVVHEDDSDMDDGEEVTPSAAPPAQPMATAPPFPSRSAPNAPASAPLPFAINVAPAHADDNAAANPNVDPTFSLWAMSRGLGAAVPPLPAPLSAAQVQQAAEALNLHPTLQQQLLDQFAALAATSAPPAAPMLPAEPQARHLSDSDKAAPAVAGSAPVAKPVAPSVEAQAAPSGASLEAQLPAAPLPTPPPSTFMQQSGASASVQQAFAQPPALNEARCFSSGQPAPLADSSSTYPFVASLLQLAQGQPWLASFVPPPPPTLSNTLLAGVAQMPTLQLSNPCGSDGGSGSGSGSGNQFGGTNDSAKSESCVLPPVAPLCTGLQPAPLPAQDWSTMLANASLAHSGAQQHAGATPYALLQGLQ